jgi:hypothetical protein
VHADLLDEQPEQFFGLLWSLGGEDVVELVGEVCEGGGVRRVVGRCREPAGKVGFLVAQGFEARTVALDPLLAIGRRKLVLLKGFEIALELALKAGDLGAD